MTKEDAKVFLEYAGNGEELYFVHNNRRLFLRAYMDNQVVHGEVWDYDHMENDSVWRYEGDYKYALTCFASSPIFNGKSFDEAQEEIQWVSSFCG